MAPDARTVVVALGGNALMRRGERPSADAQRRNLRRAAGALASIAQENALVVTHGNGPQVGWLALQAEAVAAIDPFPLDVLGAQTQGMIGYMIEDELRDRLGDTREIATLLTQVVVDAADPGFEAPSKPVGPVYSEAKARALADRHGWTMAAEGPHWRRVVPSPEPRRILELRVLELLIDAGVIVICAGGGGVPVVADPDGGWRGVEAVVDKDLSAALLADALAADVLLLLTDVDAVYADWDSDSRKPIARATPKQLRSASFAAGTMGPKVEAACRFVEASANEGRSRRAAIGALEDAEAVLAGTAGTRIETD